VGSDGSRESCAGSLKMLRDVAMATYFGTQFSIIDSVGYKFGCMIASDTWFDSRGGFSGQAVQ